MATATDSGLIDISSIVKGNVGLRIGSWSAGAAGSGTSVAVESGGTAVLAAGISLKTAPSLSSAGPTALPVLLNYSFANGNPNMTITPGTRVEEGNYWMIVKLS